MDFGAVPPEVNSGRMYAGPGSAPMSAAATAWSRLAAEFGSAASAYESVVADLTGHGWLGPASESMAAAAAPYAVWMRTTAGQAEQAAAQAASAVAAFEEAHAAVVPPPVIAVNRAELATLVATNILGQNGAAIAATEAQYGQMWVQDAAAMYGYAGRSAAAAAVTPFAEPPAVTNPTDASGEQSQLSQLIAAIPRALQGLAPGAGSVAPLQGIVQAPTITQIVSYVEIMAKSVVPFNDAIKTLLYGMVQYSRNLNTDLDIAAATGGQAGFGSGIAALAVAESAGSGVAPVANVSVGIGNAATVGRLTVPSAWVQAAPLAKAAVAALPAAGSGAAAAAVPTGIFTDMALASLAGRAIAGNSTRDRPVSVASVMNGHAPGRLERMVTEIAGSQEVQHWHVDPSRLDSLLEELSDIPGVHAVHVNDDGTEPKLPPQSGSAGVAD